MSDKTNTPDYEALARDMMQQWQDSWKTMLKDGPDLSGAAVMPHAKTETQSQQPAADPDVDIAQTVQESWQNLMQPMMATTQQFWQQMLNPVAPTTAHTNVPPTDSANVKEEAPHAVDAERASPNNASPNSAKSFTAAPESAVARPAEPVFQPVQQPLQPTVQPAAAASQPVAPVAAPPAASADAHAELARRVDLLSQRLLRCEVELDKIKRATI